VKEYRPDPLMPLDLENVPVRENDLVNTKVLLRVRKLLFVIGKDLEKRELGLNGYCETVPVSERLKSSDSENRDEEDMDLVVRNPPVATNARDRVNKTLLVTDDDRENNFVELKVFDLENREELDNRRLLEKLLDKLPILVSEKSTDFVKLPDVVNKDVKLCVNVPVTGSTFERDIDDERL
jgi:hypothetical protein